MQQGDGYGIRTMTRSEVDLAVDWAAEEGWNPGLHDAECFHAADPKGFLIGLIDQEPIATISAVKYGDAFGFIGFYIVRPDCRGKGYGLQIWNAAMACLAGRSIGLDGVVSQQANYAKSGFTLAYRNIRYGGTGGGAVPDDPRIAPRPCFPLADVQAYDRPFFPGSREAFLTHWLVQPQSTALVHPGRERPTGRLRRRTYLPPGAQDRSPSCRHAPACPAALPGSEGPHACRNAHLPRRSRSQPCGRRPRRAARYDARVRDRPHVRRHTTTSSSKPAFRRHDV